MREMWELLLPLYFEGPFDPSLPKEMAAQTYFHHETHNYAFSVNNPNYDVRARLGEIRVPTLVICGGKDWITPLSTSEQIVAGIAGSRLEVFDKSGHMPMLEEPEKFISVLRSFLAAERQ
jgi:proline iminopeptidase